MDIKGFQLGLTRAQRREALAVPTIEGTTPIEGDETHVTGTPLSGLHHKERWLSFGASLAKGETSAARCDVAVSTAFRWRHRFLAAARSDSEVLKGIVEADETYVLESRKGARGLGRKARRRGGKAKKRGLSREQVPVLMAADRSGTTVSAVRPGSMRRRSRPPSTRWSRCWSPTAARRRTLEPRSTQPRGAICMETAAIG